MLLKRTKSKLTRYLCLKERILILENGENALKLWFIILYITLKSFLLNVIE